MKMCPCDGVKMPKSKHADRGHLSHAQVAALAAAVTYLPEVIQFLAYTGLRWGEMAALRVQDFDMLRRRVNVSRSFTEVGKLQFRAPKTGERRSVPFPASLTEELAALMVGKDRDDLVFTSERGAVMRAQPTDPGCSMRQRRRSREPQLSSGPRSLRRPAWRPHRSSQRSVPTICATRRPVWRSARVRMSKRCNGCSDTRKRP
jgi:integrase